MAREEARREITMVFITSLRREVNLLIFNTLVTNRVFSVVGTNPRGGGPKSFKGKSGGRGRAKN